MLDRSKLAKEIDLIAARLFFDASPAVAQACLLWERMAHDESLIGHVIAADLSKGLPVWKDSLNTIVEIPQSTDSYTVVAVDGSQIYPDRHQGSSCFLVNIGLVLLRYGVAHKRVQFCTKPYIFAGDEDPLMQGCAIDFVNCQREAFEFADALTFVQEQCEAADVPMLLMFDGSLVFWHLESKDHALRKHFLQLYYSLLGSVGQAQIPYVSYLSLPRSKDLMQLMNFACGRYGDCSVEGLGHVLDVHVMQSLLPPYCRSTFFACRSKAIEQYPEAIRPYFCYCNVGQEIARIEMPSWLAQDSAAADLAIRIVLDQALKGRGYPVVLAEAHEQAVVKGPDRDFFYHLIRRAAPRGACCSLSQKSLKKKTIGI